MSALLLKWKREGEKKNQTDKEIEIEIKIEIETEANKYSFRSTWEKSAELVF